jgi:glutamine amidotransferase
MIAIVDYKVGNLRSVARAFEHLGYDVVVSSKKEDIVNAERIVLPGVGAFQKGIQNLKELDLVDTLYNEVVLKKKPFLGICLGMQLLVKVGYETGRHQGLGWIDGECHKFQAESCNLRLPHMGWNDVNIINNNTIFSGLGKNPCYYFCHSYHIVCGNSVQILASCEYGEQFSCAISKENIFAVQFHPEKSFDDGFKLLKNFCTVK